MVATSLRIITRLKKDWITTGRRPDGINIHTHIILIFYLSFSAYTRSVSWVRTLVGAIFVLHSLHFLYVCCMFPSIIRYMCAGDVGGCARTRLRCEPGRDLQTLPRVSRPAPSPHRYCTVLPVLFYNYNYII